jgi:DMSO reductase anchor subunit
VPQWHHPLVPPGYLALAGFSGMALLAALSAFGGAAALPAALTILLGLGAAALKLAYWRRIDAGPRAATAESATSLGWIGRVRTLDPPHTETNYLLREMGFRIARKHAAKLRRIALIGGFALPILLALAAVQLGGGGVLLPLAALLALAGLLVERWLMFAEARHTVTLYYRGT